MKCCICGKEINGYGNNPYPLDKRPGKKCCDECNYKHIVPLRLGMAFAKENKNDNH